jgi:hypothetical protein
MKTARFHILLALVLRCLFIPATACAVSGHWHVRPFTHPRIFQRQALALPATFARLARIRDFGDYLVRQLAGHGQLAWVGNADLPSISFFKITRNGHKNGNGSRSKPAALLPLEHQPVFFTAVTAQHILDYLRELSFETFAEFGAVFNGVVLDGKTRHILHATPSETWEEVVKTIEDYLKMSEHKLFRLTQYDRGPDVWFAIGSYFDAKFYDSDFLPEPHHSLRRSA